MLAEDRDFNQGINTMSAPLHFQPHIGSAVDEENRIAIHRPRLVPAEAPYDIEYQYPIFKNDKRLEGIALFVTDSWARGRSSSEQVFVIDLVTAHAIDSALDLTFLRELSHGLVAVFQSRTDNAHVVRYIVVTSVRELVARGVNDTSQLEVMEDGRAILAQVIVRANGGGGSVLGGLPGGWIGLSPSSE